jgi:hypothetical protein
VAASIGLFVSGMPCFVISKTLQKEYALSVWNTTPQKT